MKEWFSISKDGLPKENGLYLFRNKDEGSYIIGQVYQEPVPHWAHACNRLPSPYKNDYQVGICEMKEWAYLPK